MNIRSCENCHYSSNDDFKEVANLKNSGLIIYIHDEKSKKKRSFGDRTGNNIILHNTSDRDIKRFDYIIELCQYRTKCLRCKMLIQRVRNAIDDISSINKNEVIGVCDFCKRSHQKNKCKRCEYIIEKFVKNKAIQNENRDAQLKIWLSKLQQILISVLDAKVICKHNIRLDLEYKTQMHRLLNSLNSPVATRQPDIYAFPDLLDLKESGVDVSESKKIIEDLVKQFKYKGIGENADVELTLSSSDSDSECICKYFFDNKKDRKPGQVDTEPKKKDSLYKTSTAEDILMENQGMSMKKDSKVEYDTTLKASSEHQKHLQHQKSKSENIFEKSGTDTVTGQKTETITGQKSKLSEVSKKTRNRNLKSNKENDPTKEISSKNGKDTSDNNVKKGTEKGKKERNNSEYRLMLQMLKEREKEKKLAEQLGKIKKSQQLPTIRDLPVIKQRKIRVNAENFEIQKSESVLECKDKHLDVITEMIKGTEIVHLDSHYHVDEGLQKLPLLYKVKTNVSILPIDKQPLSLPNADGSKPKKQDKEVPVDTGLIRYRLSDREFINKGWTKLPSTKIMRRTNIYKMLPASTKFDWFKSHKKDEFLFYHTGEKFAEINDAGGGKWFYKNGNIALDAHSAKDSKVKRYVIYSSGEDNVSGRKDPITILGCFDYFGNGVVYDCYGNVRLKYNQSEGVLIDETISAPCRWKWHTLNDPPVLQQVFLNTYDKSNKSDFIKFSNTPSDVIRQPDEEMIAIELDNFVKEKAHKLMQKFKPLQIRIKVLKINNFFSLRIIDQANIFLLFRCDGMYFKLSIGMLLKNNEIVDTDTAEMSEVSTPYDKFPPRSPRLIIIQNTLNNVRKRYGSSKKNKL